MAKKYKKKKEENLPIPPKPAPIKNREIKEDRDNHTKTAFGPDSKHR